MYYCITGVGSINTHPTRFECRPRRLPLMSMFTDMANVSAIGRINEHSFLLAAAGYLCVNFKIWGAGSELSKHRRPRDECLFIRHRYCYHC